MGIYKDCDIRGVYGEDLTEEVIATIGGAVAQMLEGRSIVVGGDYRTHTPQLKKAFVDALLAAGADVYDVGQVSTPQLYFSKRFLGTYASAQVTASHNPAKYNGVKLMFGEQPALADTIDRVRELAEKGEFPAGEGTLHTVDTTDEYEKMLVGRFGGMGRKLKVVIDAGNGAMSVVAPEVMAKLGFDVVPLFCEYDGTFPNRNPNPALAEATVPLCEKVAEVGADFGVAFDGDGDRAIFVDENGKALIAEEALVIYVNHLVKPGDSVVYDLKCSSIVKNAVLAHGGEPIMERSGHGFIRGHLIRANSVLGGEVSGHYFFNELHGDDGLYATVVMADILTNSDRSIRGELSDVTYTSITPDIRVRATPDEIDAVFERMEAWAADEGIEPVRVDGVRLEFADGSWALLRRSITEPAFTMRFEAATDEGLAALKARAAEKLQVKVD